MAVQPTLARDVTTLALLFVAVPAFTQADFEITPAERESLAAIADRQEEYLNNFWFEDGFEGGQTTIASHVSWFWQGLALRRLGNESAAQGYLDGLACNQLARLEPAPLAPTVRLRPLLLGSPELLAVFQLTPSGFLTALVPWREGPDAVSVIERAGYAIRWRNGPDAPWGPFVPLDQASMVGYGYVPSTPIARAELVPKPLFADLQAMAVPDRPEIDMRLELWNHGREPLQTEIVGWVVLTSERYRSPELHSATAGRVLSASSPIAPPLRWASETDPAETCDSLLAPLAGEGLPALPDALPRLWKRWRGALHPLQKYVHRDRFSLAIGSDGIDTFAEELSFEDPVTLNYAWYLAVLEAAPGVFTGDPLINELYRQAAVLHGLVDPRRLSAEIAPVNVRLERPADAARRTYEQMVRSTFRRPTFGQPPTYNVEVRGGRITLPGFRELGAFLESVQALAGVAWDIKEQSIVVAPEAIAYPPWHPLAGRTWQGVAARRLQTPVADVALSYTEGLRRGQVEVSPRRMSFTLEVANRIDSEQEVRIRSTTPMQLAVADDPKSATRGELVLSLAPGKSMLVAVEMAAY